MEGGWGCHYWVQAWKAGEDSSWKKWVTQAFYLNAWPFLGSDCVVKSQAAEVPLILTALYSS